jgi:hypothetical protein
MLKNDVGSTSHINVEPMLMQRLFNVESMLMHGQLKFNVVSTLMCLLGDLPSNLCHVRNPAWIETTA